MPMDITPDEFEIILPTVGFEGELHEIRFLVIKDNEITFVGNDVVLPVFDSTIHGVSCVQDVDNNERTPEELRKIENRNGFILERKNTKTSYIFEFITHPSSNEKKIEEQFSVLNQIELDLIESVFDSNLKKNNTLLPVKDWLRQYSTEQLSVSDDVNNMYVMLDYSRRNLKAVSKIKKFKYSEQVVKHIQEELKHHVQFNFVVALGTKMGSMLVSMMDTNNNDRLPELEDKLKKTNEQIDELKSYDIAKEPYKTAFQDYRNNADLIQKRIDRSKKQRSILLNAERYAENACEFIRHEVSKSEVKMTDSSDDPAHRKLIKLEGLFFILSMRILTETNYLQLRQTETSKNKYPFFLKTQLSDLIDCLSENDKALLFSIQHTWGDKQKNELLAHIAGSHQALTVRYDMGDGKVFTVKDVIESTLGWRPDQPGLCDWFPGASIKPLNPRPVEPEVKGLRSKKHEQPLGRVLLEYRYSKTKTLSKSLKEMLKMLENSALFCKTTYLHKQRLSLESLDSMVQYLAKKDGLIEEKAEFVRMLKLYRPDVLDKLKIELPEIMREIHVYQQDLDNEIKMNPFSGEKVDKATKKAMEYIFSGKSLDDPKEMLKKILVDPDIDLTLKQINHLYFLLNRSEDLLENRKLITDILIELFREEIFLNFQFPFEPSQKKYLNHIMEFYPMAHVIPDVVEFIHLLNFFSNEYREGFDISAPDQKNGTMLDYACQMDVPHLIDNLLAKGAEAVTYNLIDVLNRGILTQELADKLIQAGADPIECFYFLARDHDVDLILKMANVLGEEMLISALSELQDEPQVEKMLREAVERCQNATLKRSSILCQSATFFSTEQKKTDDVSSDKLFRPVMKK